MTIQAKGVRVALANYVLFCQLINDCRNRQEMIRSQLEQVGVKTIHYGDILSGSGKTMESKIIELVADDDDLQQDIISYKRQIDKADKFIEWLDGADKQAVVSFYMTERPTDELADERGYSESGIKKQIYGLIEEYVKFHG